MNRNKLIWDIIVDEVNKGGWFNDRDAVEQALYKIPLSELLGDYTIETLINRVFDLLHSDYRM